MLLIVCNIFDLIFTHSVNTRTDHEINRLLLHINYDKTFVTRKYLKKLMKLLKRVDKTYKYICRPAYLLKEVKNFEDQQ